MKFEVAGKADAAETVLLSAGLGGAAAFWAPQMEALAAQFRILLFDQRGTGRNAEALPEPYSIAHMADDAAAVMDASGTTRAHILGHALGGLVALEMARRHPARVGRLALVNAWAKVDRHTERCFDIRLGILHTQGPAAYVAAQPLFLHTAPYLSAHHEKIATEIAHGTTHFQGAENLMRRIGALRAFDATADLPRITASTLVAASRDDLLVPYTASERLAAGLPHAQLWLTNFGGHAFTVEHPEPFNTALASFLRGG
ncbi:pyrimidine utilization protein D [Plastoroseomonas arctica]|uniref:Putative carbamate hydrolase RutD n=1 Tax=Plastoroseomonas arctica TaxID=1509237 RepID=A0AAF1JYG0_9PROT|nr:pyrimidine utilization protein D [Plastoroseomonas arctica]